MSLPTSTGSSSHSRVFPKGVDLSKVLSGGVSKTHRPGPPKSTIKSTITIKSTTVVKSTIVIDNICVIRPNPKPPKIRLCACGAPAQIVPFSRVLGNTRFRTLCSYTKFALDRCPKRPQT